MGWHALIPLVAAVGNLVVCVPVLRQRKLEPIHWAFAGMTLAIASWNLGIFSLYYFTDPAQAEWASRVFRTGICFAPVLVYHVALLQSDPRRPFSYVLAVGYAGATLLAIANLAGLLVSGVAPHMWGWYPQPTRLYACVTALIVGYIGLTVRLMWRVYRHPASARQHTQAKFWFLASVIQAPFVVTNLLPLYGVNIYPLGNLGNVLYVGILAYAIARHRLMEVDDVVRKIVSFSMATALVLLPGGTLLGSLHGSEGGASPSLTVGAALVLALVATVLIPRLQRALEVRLQRAFMSADGGTARLRELATEIVHLLDRETLLERLGQALDEIFEVEGVATFERHEETGRWIPSGNTKEQPLPPPAVLASIEELDEPMLASELDEPAGSIFEERGWDVVLPFSIAGGVTACIVLGHKREFRLFTAQDLRMMAAVVASANLALENARLSAQLRHSERVLQQSSRLSSLGMLAAGIAHEIRNPLSAVKTFLDLLPERLEDRDFLTEFRNMSLSELGRVTNLITDLLALGKTSVTAHTSVDLVAALEPVIRLMASTARKRQVEVIFCDEGTAPPVYANAAQLKQIILNLVLNGVDASQGGGNVTVTVQARGTDHALIEVRDEGEGIPPEKLDTIFDPFFTTKETGTGLGLALVHQMVREHAGEITVESTVGLGTAFRIVLPKAELQQTGT